MMVTMCTFLRFVDADRDPCDAVTAPPENKPVEHSLDRRANNVIVIGQPKPPIAGISFKAISGRTMPCSTTREVKQAKALVANTEGPNCKISITPPDRRGAEAGCRWG